MLTFLDSKAQLRMVYDCQHVSQKPAFRLPLFCQVAVNADRKSLVTFSEVRHLPYLSIPIQEGCLGRQIKSSDKRLLLWHHPLPTDEDVPDAQSSLEETSLFSYKWKRSHIGFEERLLCL